MTPGGPGPPRHLVDRARTWAGTCLADGRPLTPVTLADGANLTRGGALLILTGWAADRALTAQPRAGPPAPYLTRYTLTPGRTMPDHPDPHPEPANGTTQDSGALRADHTVSTPARVASGDAVTDPRLAHALAYAATGWPVFVLGRSKRPLANCRACAGLGPAHGPGGCACLTCHGFYAATTDPDRIRAILATAPRGLLAIRTGAWSGLVVVDIDPRNGGRLDPDLMPPTAYVTTAGGGLHLYYRHPGGERIPSRPLPGHPGVDIKADGGYVVAPPSTLTPGRAYRWAESAATGPTGWAGSVREMASALASLCRAPVPAPPPSHHPANPRPERTHDRPHAPAGGGAISSPSALLAATLKAVHDAPKGRHRVTLYGAARGVARMVAAGALTPAEAWDALWATAKAAGQSDREARGAILGGFRAEHVPDPAPDRKAG